ncbi:MAG: DUF2851 family protein [Raineya sp.]
MKESLLHFVWQYQYFEQQDLRTSTGEKLHIFEVGKANTNAGADFEQVKIQIGDITWQGDAEIHIKASDWRKHQHQYNARYNQVILHIVWEEDEPILRPDGTPIATLVLKDKIKSNIFDKYQYLQASKSEIACEKLIGEVDSLHKTAMLDKALVRRLEQKSSALKELWLGNQKDWEESTYQILAQNFGFKVNSSQFLRLSRLTPLKYLRKHSDQILQIEALLFGQAGFLEQTFAESYPQTLQKEYAFLKAKYSLERMNANQWNFLRLRPANFPTLRIAQFAQMLAQNINLFSFFLYAEKPKTLERMLQVSVSEYWKKHYIFEKEVEKTASTLGKSSLGNILINTICPLLVLYGKENSKQEFIDKAIFFLEQSPAEKNTITEKWRAIGLSPKNAADSQALIEQYNFYCSSKNCLECSVGTKILKQST